MKKFYFQALVVLFLIVVPVSAQTTAFNYQGRLTEGGNPANGAFQMQFKLFDSLAGGNQIGATLADIPITVTNGVFATKLDFGANALSGANRWLEIAVRHNSSEFYTTLSPREQIASSPYAVRTLSASVADNALNLGGIPANQYVTTASVGNSFIRNGLATQTANFNISGDGFMGGNLALGTFNGTAKLEVAGTGFGAQQRITDNTSGNSLVFQSGAGNNMKVTGYNYNTDTAVPLYLSVDGANTNVGGNLTQNRSSGGSVKAMVFVNGINGSIVRCYNGVSGASIPTCGFSAERVGTGFYRLTFPFQINDRFFSLSTFGFGVVVGVNDTLIGQTGSFPTPTSVNIHISESISGGRRDGDFSFIVY